MYLNYDGNVLGQERGMRAHGLTTFAYKRQLKEWLDLSVQKNIPISLLILSRAFLLTSATPGASEEEALRSSITQLNEEVLNEAVIEAASRDVAEDDTTEMRKRKLDSVLKQKEVFILMTMMAGV